jgi:hypothetical protein
VPFSAARQLLGNCADVRSTLVTLSLDAVRTRGRLADYERRLTARYREAIFSSIAGVWLPLDVAQAHYAAVDALGFTSTEAMTIGQAVGDRINGTLLGTMVKLAAGAGVTPWFALGYSGKLYERIFHGGGGVSIVRLGPKEARAEVVGVPLLGVGYFRAAMRGMFKAACELVSRRTYVTELASYPTAVSLRVSWA